MLFRSSCLVSYNCNLLDNSFNVGSVVSKLMSIDEEYLSTWFVNNYIGQCAQLCPDNVLRLINNNSRPTSRQLQSAVSKIVRRRLNTSLYDFWVAVFLAEVSISSAVSRRSLTVRSCICWMNELAKIDERFTVYFSAVTLLQVACRTTRNGFSDELMNIMETVLGRNFSQCCSVLSVCKTELNTSKLVELLQKSAVEHLTTYRQLEARDFGSVVTLVTTDFDALYAYKRGDYQRCLQLSTVNVHTLLYAADTPIVPLPVYPVFLQLLDDDIVSLTALTLIFVGLLSVYPASTHDNYDTYISQLTLSLYLMTQCQLSLRHSVTSLAHTLDYIKVAQRGHPCESTLDQLTLRLIERKAQQTFLH